VVLRSNSYRVGIGLSSMLARNHLAHISYEHEVHVGAKLG